MNIRRLIILLMGLLLFIVFLFFENNNITVTHINIKSDKLPDSFDGYTIVHLSDLHSKYFGKNQKSLVSIVEDAQPDLIALTGDMVDSNRYDEQPVLELIRQIRNSAPIYYVAGNHEIASLQFEYFKKKLKEIGVTVLRGTVDKISKSSDCIFIAGVDDPVGYFKDESKFLKNQIKEAISEISKNDFIILLSHRPEKFDVYASLDIDLTLSGHAHGGQIRIPYIGALYAPGQGFWPKYTSGVHKSGSSMMVISRGLGNSLIPQRLFNRPEVVVITLKK